MSGFLAEVGDIDFGHWVGGENDKFFTMFEPRHRLAGLQGRQGTFQSLQIKCGFAHRCLSVNCVLHFLAPSYFKYAASAKNSNAINGSPIKVSLFFPKHSQVPQLTKPKRFKPNRLHLWVRTLGDT